MNHIVTGSCYLDKGEDKAYIKQTVSRMATLGVPLYYTFDVICLPSQVQEATQCLKYFYTCLEEMLPDLDLSKVFTGITCDDRTRPGGTALMTLPEMDNLAFGIVEWKTKDINPSRKPR